jgi:peptidyl-prolyl cis-trans isomerase SurA
MQGIRRLVLVAAGAALVAVPNSLRAQDDDRFKPVDRIVAVVGGRPILQSKVDETINMARAMGQEFPQDSAERAALVEQLVNDLVDDELIVQAAQRDTAIEVMTTDVQAAVEQQLRQIRQQFGSESEFGEQLQVAGFGTLEEYRRWLTEAKRRELLRNQFIRTLRQKGTIAPIQPTERETREFYEKNKARFPKRPASVTFRQLVIRPMPDSGAVARARFRADSIVRELRRGADFATTARRFSEDPASKEYGGELGWIRRGQGFVREFEAAAFRLSPGQISDPVRTAFGFHIIQVQRIEPAEVQARHILIAPTVTDEDRAEAAALADSAAAWLRRGASFDSLVRLHGDSTEQVLLEGVPRTQLPDPYATALQGANPGDIVGPFPYESAPGLVKHVVAWYQSSVPEGEFTYEDLRDRIRAQLAEESVLDRYVALLRNQTYVDIRL